MNDSELRWHLRQLPRSADPGHDLWPGIAARLQAPRRDRATNAGSGRRRPWAAAAGVALLGLGLTMAPDHEAGDPQARMVQRQVDALTREYQAAFAQLPAAAAAQALAPGLRDLDLGAAQIRQALRQQPQATYLIERLQRTYARRLELSQRALQG